MLGTENYGTSFQSLMSPMYNVNANYSMNGYGIGGAYGSAYGNGYMGGFMTPMANVGIGQFDAKYLIQDDASKNNYYARPIATHKKKDETGTILGIGAAALATIALIAAACKGKKVTVPPVGPNGPVGPVNPPIGPVNPNTITDPSRLLPSPETVTQMPTSQGYTRTAITGSGGTGAIIDDATKAIKPGTRLDNVTTKVPEYLNPNTTAYNFVENTGNRPGYNHVNTILNGQTTISPENATKLGVMTDDAKAAYDKVLGQQFKPDWTKLGYTPAQSGLAKDVARREIGMTFSGDNLAKYYTSKGQMTPQAQEAYNKVLGQQFKPDWTKLGYTPAQSVLAKEAARVDAREAFTQLTENTADDFIRPIVTRKNNRFANVSGQLYQAKFAPFGLSVDTQAYANLPSNLHREFNNIVVNGSESALKNITCDPRFEGIFRLV